MGKFIDLQLLPTAVGLFGNTVCAGLPVKVIFFGSSRPGIRSCPPGNEKFPRKFKEAYKTIQTPPCSSRGAVWVLPDGLSYECPSLPFTIHWYDHQVTATFWLGILRGIGPCLIGSQVWDTVYVLQGGGRYALPSSRPRNVQRTEGFWFCLSLLSEVSTMTKTMGWRSPNHLHSGSSLSVLWIRYTLQPWRFPSTVLPINCCCITMPTNKLQSCGASQVQEFGIW